MAAVAGVMAAANTSATRASAEIMAGATCGTSGADTAMYSFRLAIEQQSSDGAGS